MAGSNGDFWSTEKIEAVAAVLAVSPQQLETILAYIQEGSLVTGNCIFSSAPILPFLFFLNLFYYFFDPPYICRRLMGC